MQHHQDKAGKVATKFNATYGIAANKNYTAFDETLLQYKYNSLSPEFQNLIANDIRSAILTAQKGFISHQVIKQYFRTLNNNLKPEYLTQIVTLYKETMRAYNQSYFAFGGINSGIKVDKTTWPFANGFAFCIWVQVENVNYEEFNEQTFCTQKLISVHGTGQSAGGGLECYIIRGSVYYRVIPAVYTEPTLGNGAVFVGQLRNGLNFIGISHEIPKKFSSAHLNVYFNNDPPKTLNLDYPKISQAATLNRFIVCENIFGTMQCTIIMNQSSSKMKQIQQVYANGSMDFKQVKTLPSILEKYFERIMTIYLPEFAVEGRVYDIVGQCHGTLLQKSVYVIADRNKFNLYGGFKVYCALLQLCGSIHKSIQQTQLNLGTMMEILNNILRNNNHLQQEASNICIFSTIGSIIQSFQEPVIGGKFVEIIQETKQILFDTKLIDQFFVYILWNPRLIQKCANEQIFQKLLQVGCAYYSSNAYHFTQLIAFKDLMDILTYSFQDTQCCTLHYPDQDKSYQITLFERMLYLFNQINDINENLLIFDHYLLAKIPPCLLVQFFKVMKSLLVDGNEAQGIQTKAILSQWNQNNIVHSLLFIFKTSPYYDIRSQVIYFLNLIFQQQFSGYKLQVQEAIELIQLSIEPIWESANISKVKRTEQSEEPQVEINELKNLGTQFMNSDYESVPVAPSMTNRRKQGQGFFETIKQPPRALSTQPMEIEKPKKQSQSVDQKNKRKFNIKIDTESINALYSYGGERGKKMEFDNDAFAQELKEIYELAGKCHQHMQGVREDKDPFIMPSTRSPRQAPMSTRNSQAQLFQIQQQQPQKQEQILHKQSKQFQTIQQPIKKIELNSIKEVSQSSMSLQVGEVKKQGQSLTQTYAALLGWMIDKLNIDANDEITMIEEGDSIKNSSVMNAILKVLQCSTDDHLKAQILQDLMCLTKSDQSNAIQMLGQQNCHNEILKILLVAKQKDSGLIWEIGSKFYSNLLINVVRYEFIGADYIYELIKFGKSNGQYELTDQLLCQVLEGVQQSQCIIRDLCKVHQPSLDNQLWQNIINIGLNLTVENKDTLKLSITVYRRILQILFKECNIDGKDVESQYQQIATIFNNNIQQILIRIQELLNYQTQNIHFYEICLQLLESDQIIRLLITYAIVSEFSQTQQCDVLIRIYSKYYANNDPIHGTTLLLMIAGAYRDKFQTLGFTQRSLTKLIDGFNDVLDCAMAQNFNIELINSIIFHEPFAAQLEYTDKIINFTPFQAWQTESLVNINKFQTEIQLYGEDRLNEIDMKKKQWLQLESEKERVGKNQLHKYLKNILTFNGWMAPYDFYDYSQNNEVFSDPNVTFPYNPYYSISISKWNAKDMYRPFLKINIKVPPHFISKSTNNFGNSTCLLMQDVIKNEAVGPQLLKTANQILTMGKVLGNNLRNTFKTILPKQQGVSSPVQLDYKNMVEDTFRAKKVQLISSLYVAQGFLTLTMDYIIFQYEYLKCDQTHVSLSKFVLQDHKLLIKSWPLFNLVQVIKKKYLQRKSALELLFIDGKSLFINVMDQSDLDEIAQKFLRIRKTIRAPHFNQNKTTDPLKMLEKQGYTQKWQKQQISNFKYLMMLNHLASRSYNDLTQYPIMPWVIVEHNRPRQPSNTLIKAILQYPDGQFRDLSRTMGALGGNQRIKSYLERFETTDPQGEIPPFHYGSHYSSPAITSQYLIRMEPFTSASREIQGGKFDIADRIFYSIIESFRCATEDVADVRELIPEMFCLPEMFLNLQNLPFGKTQSNQIVNNVQLPKWCEQNPYKYVVGLKNALESREVQHGLPGWIDLIFGYKQRGKEAEKALNKFFYLTYDNLVIWDKQSEPIQLSMETQIVNFGITPLQLFIKPHISRQIDLDHKYVTQFTSDLKVYRPPNKKKIPNTMSNIINYQEAGSKAIVKIKWLSDVRLVCLRKEGRLDFLKWTSQNDQNNPQSPPFSCGLEREKPVSIEKLHGDQFTLWDPSVVYGSYPVCILNQGKLLFCGGYFGGKLVVVGETNQVQEVVQLHTSTITAIQNDKYEQVLVTGDKLGHVILWKITPEYKVQVKQEYYDHQDQINQININLSLKLFATGCNGGIVNIYNIYNGSMLRSIMHPNRNPINAIQLSNKPLACLIFQSSRDKYIYSYSINGQLLESVQESCNSIIDCKTIRNSIFQDILVYGTEQGELVMRALPFLQEFKRFPISAKSPVLSISRSKDKRFLLCSCNDGEISVMAEHLNKN